MSAEVARWEQNGTVTTVGQVFTANVAAVVITQDTPSSEMLHDQRVCLTRDEWRRVGTAMGWTPRELVRLR